MMAQIATRQRREGAEGLGERRRARASDEQRVAKKLCCWLSWHRLLLKV